MTTVEMIPECFLSFYAVRDNGEITLEDVSKIFVTDSCNEVKSNFFLLFVIIQIFGTIVKNFSFNFFRFRFVRRPMMPFFVRGKMSPFYFAVHQTVPQR